jgi:hypothetical protein
MAHAAVEAAAGAVDDVGAGTLPATAHADHATGGSWDPMLSMLCSVGHAGEMFTSAAPYDPLFWPLHGLADRCVFACHFPFEDHHL